MRWGCLSVFVAALSPGSAGRAQPTLLPSSPARRGSTAVANTVISVGDYKAKLLRVALLSGRGSWARPSERSQAHGLIEALEQSAESNLALQDGTWELVLSSVEPFRASTFFLALGEAVERNIMAGASDGALTVHSLATGGGDVQRIAYVIEDDGSRLHSLVELQSGSLPSVPLALQGTVISSAELQPLDADAGTGVRFSLALMNTSVQESRVKYGLPTDSGLRPGEQPDLLSWVGDQLVPSGEIFSQTLASFGGRQNTAELRLSYSDGDMMVLRAPRLRDHFFVFVRGEAEAWPAMDELRGRQSTAAQSPSILGSAFALGMLNPFFTRVVGLRDRDASG